MQSPALTSLKAALKNRKSERITNEGAALVIADPDLGRNTLRALLNTEASYLTPELLEILESSQRLDREARKLMQDNSQAGLVTISTCIKENPEQTIAELVVRYGKGKRQYPYVYLATLIKHYYDNYGLSIIYVRGNKLCKKEWKAFTTYSTLPQKRKAPPSI